MRDPTCQFAFSIAGGVLQLIGAFFAGVGLWRAYQRLNRRPQFLIHGWEALQAAGRRTHRFYRRRIENPVRQWLGKKPRKKVVHASVASSTATAGSARVSVSRYGKANRRHDRELKRLRRDLLDLERRHEDLRNELAEQGRELRRELREEATERERRDEQVHDYARDLLAGVFGAGGGRRRCHPRWPSSGELPSAADLLTGTGRGAGGSRRWLNGTSGFGMRTYSRRW